MALWIVMAHACPARLPGGLPQQHQHPAVKPDDIRLDVADAVHVEALVEELASPDETAALYAIDLLESLDKRHSDHAAAAPPSTRPPSAAAR